MLTGFNVPTGLSVPTGFVGAGAVDIVVEDEDVGKLFTGAVVVALVWPAGLAGVVVAFKPPTGAGVGLAGVAGGVDGLVVGVVGVKPPTGVDG